MDREIIVFCLFLAVGLLIAEIAVGSWTIDVFTQWWFWLVLVFASVGTAVFSMRKRKPGIELGQGEFVLKQYHGLRCIAEGKRAFSIGRWYITNKQLIFDSKDESEALSYSVDKLENIEKKEEGSRDFHLYVGGITPIHKFLLATFKKNGTVQTVRIHLRKMEDFKESLQKASAQRLVSQTKSEN
jgi:hypothetical protein